jgi:S-adenosylmethionine:tRNA ribosyltransferase-isomerase
MHAGWEDGRTLGKTDLFIFPPFRFRLVDHLITNFHLPGSSLMMLVEAFLQYKGAKRKLTDLYDVAVREKFRFYSFGDAMLIL